jgi:hypothetical protein
VNEEALAHWGLLGKKKREKANATQTVEFGFLGRI